MAPRGRRSPAAGARGELRAPRAVDSGADLDSRADPGARAAAGRLRRRIRGRPRVALRHVRARRRSRARGGRAVSPLGNGSCSLPRRGPRGTWLLASRGPDRTRARHRKRRAPCSPWRPRFHASRSSRSVAMLATLPARRCRSASASYSRALFRTLPSRRRSSRFSFRSGRPCSRTAPRLPDDAALLRRADHRGAVPAIIADCTSSRQARATATECRIVRGRFPESGVATARNPPHAPFTECPTMSDAPRDGLSRRAFGQLLGAAALAGAMPNASLAALPSMTRTPDASPEPPAIAGDELCDLTASISPRAFAASRCRRARSWPRTSRASSASTRRSTPIVTLVADRAMADAREGGRAAGARRYARPAAWTAGRAQGSRQHGRHPHDVRLAAVTATTCRPSTR